MSELSDYEKRELAKLMMVIEAGCANTVGSGDGIRIETAGHNPHCSAIVQAYVLRKLFKLAEARTP